MDVSNTTKLIALRADLAAAEAKASQLATAYGAAFALYNHQCDLLKALRNEVAVLERQLLDSIR